MSHGYYIIEIGCSAFASYIKQAPYFFVKKKAKNFLVRVVSKLSGLVFLLKHSRKIDPYFFVKK